MSDSEEEKFLKPVDVKEKAELMNNVFHIKQITLNCVHKFFFFFLILADIFDETVLKLKPLGLGSKCLGGGRITHTPKEKKINVFGHSQGFGKADHQITVGLLKKFYKDYEITISDE
ncbi:sex-regulated protein janus-A-like [Lycorma delicatula]|uniref:sex-regulated protein janus-A-like n=1 Tax=Lycorma delicatula TaxID=130591 RepID=UPI003F513688